MKTRNWKLCILAIFLAVCFTIYAGNCYPQILGDNWSSFYPGPSYLMPQPFDYTGTYLTLPYYWGIPAGQTTLELFQDLMPSLRYETFYNMDYFPGIVNLYDNYGLSTPVMDNWTLYQRMDLYTRPKAGEQVLYQFTKDFLVKPRKPDLHTGYGMYGAGGISSMFGFSGMGVIAGMDGIAAGSMGNW